jgi:murein DD-endopeptidase MepM/ murein hydrolase activator NlpD
MPPTSTPVETSQLLEVELPLTPENIPFQVCSPLSIHPLEELPEIISDPYRPPPPGKEQRHHGVDFSYYRRGERLTIQGVGVQSVLPGIVAASLTETFPYGNVVIIETPYDSLPDHLVAALNIAPGFSIYTLYAHMDQPTDLDQGEQLDACQLLGEVGVSGNTVEPHLHLEMRLGAPGERFTSLGFYKADDTEEERSNYLRWRTSGEFQHFDPMLVLTASSSEQSAEN